MQNKTGLYIHIPFCVKKCNYCAFLSFDAETSPRKEYTDALVNEIKLRAMLLSEPAALSEGKSAQKTDESADAGEADCRDAASDRRPEIDTVYVGGGTPSVLDISQMRDIMHAVETSFRLKEGAEITIEANPATLGRKDGVMLAKLQAYKYMGFNRLSMGVQSMDNDRLHYLGRIHTAENVARDMELARRKGFDNINLDLIFSVPGSSTEDALFDLEKILELKPEHISCYSLQIEEGTPFGEMAASGELTEVSDEDDRRTYHEICRRLREAGYEHYEISNFARMDEDTGRALRSGTDSAPAPDFEAKGNTAPDSGSASGAGSDPAASQAQSPYRSRHNSLYWDMSDYIAVGLGASGFVNGVRYKNTSDIEEYLRIFSDRCCCSQGGQVDAAAGNDADARIKTALEEEHINSAFDNISEAVFTGLRRREGITYKEALEAYSRRGGRLSGNSNHDAFWEVFADSASETERYVEQGLLILDNEGIRLTEGGIDISNSIMSLFV